MDYTHLGRSGLSVSKLGLGTMNFGPDTSEEDSHAIMDRALEAGVNLIDTANVYGWEMGEGVTEQIVGRWFAQGQQRREKTVLATKLYGSMSDWPNDTFLSARNIRHACDGSLRRLQTDYIDLYQMHHVDRSTPWDEIWEAFDVLRTQGKVLYFGSSNHAGWDIAKAMETAGRRHQFGLVSEQSIYNLLTRDVEREVLPACRDYGIGLIPWSPLNRGLLGGILAKTAKGKRRLSMRLKEELSKHRSAILKWEELCEELDEQPADMALAWLLHQEGVAVPILGPKTMEQLEGSLHALDITLDGDTLQRIDAIFPGPGAAPEAYAW